MAKLVYLKDMHDSKVKEFRGASWVYFGGMKGVTIGGFRSYERANHVANGLIETLGVKAIIVEVNPHSSYTIWIKDKPNDFNLEKGGMIDYSIGGL